MFLLSLARTVTELQWVIQDSNGKNKTAHVQIFFMRAWLVYMTLEVPVKIYLINPLPTIGNSLKKQKSLYKVLTPNIKQIIIMG